MDELGKIIRGVVGLVLIIGFIALIIAFPLPVIAIAAVLLLMRS